jgi:predicted SAM-dependent methyltransferase
MKPRRFESVETVASPPFGADLLAALGLRGIQCGCGRQLREGWLNTDQLPVKTRDGASADDGVIVLVDGERHYLKHDARNPFEIEDGSFEWVYSEHLLEHLTPREAVTWLREVHRLLQPGGYVRLSTPDLRKYVHGYLDPQDGFLAEHHDRLVPHLRFFADSDYVLEAEDEVPRRPAWLVNQIFRLWEHRWIYDLEEIRFVASQAGFAADAVTEHSFRQGRSPEPAALDMESRNDESLYVEIERR